MPLKKPYAILHKQQDEGASSYKVRRGGGWWDRTVAVAAWDAARLGSSEGRRAPTTPRAGSLACATAWQPWELAARPPTLHPAPSGDLPRCRPVPAPTGRGRGAHQAAVQDQAKGADQQAPLTDGTLLAWHRRRRLLEKVPQLPFARSGGRCAGSWPDGNAVAKLWRDCGIRCINEI